MARRSKIDYKSYIEDGQRHMICQNSIEGGRWWKGSLCDSWVKVGPEVTATLCHRCVNRVTEPPKFTPRYIPTGRPKGWQWMSQYVDKDGNVFHKGKEQPKLKGTIKPTKIEPKKNKKKLSKSERMRLEQAILQQMAMVRGQLKKAKWKKDINAGNTQLKKLQRQLKKIK